MENQSISKVKLDLIQKIINARLTPAEQKAVADKAQSILNARK